VNGRFILLNQLASISSNGSGGKVSKVANLLAEALFAER
jgi:hypothetical protein